MGFNSGFKGLKCATLQLMSSVGRHVKCDVEISAIGKNTGEITFTLLTYWKIS